MEDWSWIIVLAMWLEVCGEEREGSLGAKDADFVVEVSVGTLRNV